MLYSCILLTVASDFHLCLPHLELLPVSGTEKTQAHALPSQQWEFLPKPPSLAFCSAQSPLKLQFPSLPLKDSTAFTSLSKPSSLAPSFPSSLRDSTLLCFPLPSWLLILLPGSDLQLTIYTLARAGGEAARSNGKALASFHLSSSWAQPGSHQRCLL